MIRGKGGGEGPGDFKEEINGKGDADVSRPGQSSKKISGCKLH